jgi:hypothetical protein
VPQEQEQTARGRYLEMTTTNENERIVPVWLVREDVETIEHILAQFASECESDAELQHHVAELKRHFDWVEEELDQETPTGNGHG